MSYWNEMFGSDLFDMMMDMGDFEIGFSGGFDDLGSIFFLGVIKNGSEYEKFFKGYI